MMSCRTVSVALAALVLCAVPGWAEPFDLAPEGSSHDWASQFPYQRNVLIDFRTDPSTWPADGSNASASELAPAVNYHLEGSYDLTLYASDWLDIEPFSGLPPIWYAVDPVGSGRSGVFGIIEAREPSVWNFRWRLDNLPDQRAYKRVWQEIDLYWSAPQGSFVSLGIGVSPGTWSTAYARTGSGGEWSYWDVWHETSPNVEWEELYLQVLIGPGGTFLIDDWHVATECTPEPVSALLLLVGIPMVAVARRRSGAHCST